ncbi:hypothetical protein [Burkholderia ubonensis]|uniref:hypothetical protein n=1 Tax=Burkholderia ubonensis TaxID=101571 RepID=UPI000ADC8931|nr:hypothetical protein [Burkholderia ubonensis]
MSRNFFVRVLRPWGPRRETGCLSSSALSLDIVERGIWPLVQALNQVDGVRTIASCHGHRGPGLLTYNGNPYVYFEGPATFALALSEHIDRAYSRKRLIYRWRVVGQTHPELGQCISVSLESRFYLRGKLARDLAWLSQHVANQIGHGGDAVVRDDPDHRPRSSTGAATTDLHLAPAVADQLANECDRTGETLQAVAHRLIEQALRSRSEEGS